MKCNDLLENEYTDVRPAEQAVCLIIKRCTVYYVFVKKIIIMQNPKIKLFYILTIKAIKRYLYNEQRGCVDYLCIEETITF